MNLQRKVELELLKLSSNKGSLGINDTLEARLACVSMLWRLGHISDQTHLGLTVRLIQEFDNEK